MREIHDSTSTGKCHCAILGSPVRCVLVTPLSSQESRFSVYASSLKEARKLRFSRKVQIQGILGKVASFPTPQLSPFSRLTIFADDSGVCFLPAFACLLLWGFFWFLTVIM